MSGLRKQKEIALGTERKQGEKDSGNQQKPIKRQNAREHSPQLDLELKPESLLEELVHRGRPGLGHLRVYDYGGAAIVANLASPAVTCKRRFLS